MLRSLLLLFVCVVNFVFGTLSLERGDPCVDKTGRSGICIIIISCAGALRALERGTQPKTCGYEQDIPIVCCTDKKQQNLNPPATKSPVRTTTTEYTPTAASYEDLDEEETCEPLRNFPVRPTDRIAWRKCLQYQEDLIYPCQKSPSGQLSRARNCKHSANQLITGGVNAADGEFPHMVMLSYNTVEAEFEAGCGGTLISDWFILTAGHCTYKQQVGNVQYAATSALKRTEVKKENIYRIGQIIQHPNYKAPLHYHDIALLQTATRVRLNAFTVPACLDVGDDTNDHEALVTGWGALAHRAENADILQKVVLTKFSHEECTVHFVNDRKLPNNIFVEYQTCYGDKSQSRDACGGDSGGPLQLKMQRVTCMYSVVGVTSFGHKCGKVGVPGVYTRVAPYVAWIESVVWPKQ